MSTPDDPFLPYGKQWIDADDIEAVAEVLKGDWLTGGPAVDAFENAFAETTGAGHAVACANGTAALHLSALALDLAPGDQVIVPTITFLSTANAARFVGADVVFADVDPDTGLMGPKEFEDAIRRADPKKLKAVYPVDLAGQCADPAALKAVADKHGLGIVEDACHALGGSYRAGNELMPVGNARFADMAVFSLHPVKIIAMGEGGVITTNDTALANRLRRLRNQGMTRTPEEFLNKDLAFDENGAPNPWYYEMPEIGFNYRASDIHCALGLSQLKKLERFAERRRSLADHYDKHVVALAPTVKPIGRIKGCVPAWHLYAVLIDFEAAGISRADTMRRLQEKGIGSQVHYIPVHRQPYYRQRYGDLALPGADAYYARCLSLPLHVRMEDTDVERVTGALADVLGIG
ncbi:MAG: UDP-4-amino-4,6-dideoxy-N-acetyl-beta-L-altrosamine transaminase [Rhodospirillales bacterium]